VKKLSPGSGAGDLLLSAWLATAWIVTGAVEFIELTGVVERHCSDFHFSELARNRKMKHATTSRWDCNANIIQKSAAVPLGSGTDV